MTIPFGPPSQPPRDMAQDASQVQVGAPVARQSRLLFPQALHFVMSQEGKSDESMDMALAMGRGVQDNAVAEFQRRGGPARPPRTASYNAQRDYYTALYRDIWDHSGAADMPADLALVHFDAHVKDGPTAARQLLARSQGVPMRYIGLRVANWKTKENYDTNPGWIHKRLPALSHGVSRLGPVEALNASR